MVRGEPRGRRDSRSIRVDAHKMGSGRPWGCEHSVMIERVVLVSLQPEYRSADDLRRIVAQTREVLAGIPEVRALRVGSAAEPRTQEAWQLCIEVRFDDLEAVERYRAHNVHRAYVDVFLRPMMQSIRVFNFDVSV